MLAYYNDPKLKQKVLEQLQESNLNLPVEQFENNLGIPMVLVHLQDVIFWGLSNEEAKNWPIKFFSAIQVGADLSGVWRDFFVWMLIDPVDGVIQYTTPGMDAHRVIMQVATLYQDGYTQQQMRDAADAAANAADAAANAVRDASYNAARAAAKSAVFAAYTAANAAHAAYTAFVAYAAARADAKSAAHAADAAYNAARDAYTAARAAAKSAVFAAYTAANAAYNAVYIKMSNKLLELLEKQEVKHVSLP